MAKKNATVTDAKANAEKVSTDATVAAEAPKKNDAKRKRTEETTHDSAATKAPAAKRSRLDDNEYQTVRNYANSIHVSLLSSKTTKEELAKHFSDVGPVALSVIFRKRPFMGKPGFASGQVEFTSPASVAKALKKDQSVLGEATITVKAAAPPGPAVPYLALRAVGLEPSVTKADLKEALSKWADKIETIKVPLSEGENRGFATIRMTDVASAVDIFTNFKTPIKGSVLRFGYQKENPNLEQHNAKLRVKTANKRAYNAKVQAKEKAKAQKQREIAKNAAQKTREKLARIAREAKTQKAAQAAKATRAAQKIKEQKAAKIQKINEDAKAKQSKITGKA